MRPVLTSGDNGSMDSAPRPRAPLALSALLGLLAVAELVARLSASSTVRAGLAAPAGHAGVTVPTALLMCAICLLATVPAGLLRPVPAAVTVYLAAALSLALFELVTIAGAAALLVAAYRPELRPLGPQELSEPVAPDAQLRVVGRHHAHGVTSARNSTAFLVSSM